MLKERDSGLRIIVWGTGYYSRTFMELLDVESYSLLKFVDNNKFVQGLKFFEYGDIISPDELKSIEYDLLVVCISDYNAVVKQCEMLGLKNVWTYKELLEKGATSFPDLFKDIYRNKVCDSVWEAGIRNVVRKIVKPVVQEMKTTHLENSGTSGKGIKYVWSCWWQGLENAPELVKKCIERQRELYGIVNGYEHIVITKDNWDRYVDLPDFILEKVKNGVITLTELSDIIRTKLLMKWGGYWLDATIYLTATLDFEDESLYSPRIINSRWDMRDWAIYTMYSDGNNKLFYWLDKMFMEYWSKENKLIDYFLMSYLIEIIYEECDEIKKTLDNIPYNNVQVEGLALVMNRKFEERVWRELCRDTVVFKLSYKHKWYEYTVGGELTFYGAFMTGII